VLRILRPLLVATVLAVVAVAALLFAMARFSGPACAPDASGNPPSGLAATACDVAWNVIQAINRANPPAFKVSPPGRQPNAVGDPSTGALPTAVTFDPKLPPVFELRSRAAPTRPFASGQLPNSEVPSGAWEMSGTVGNTQVSFPAYVGVVGYIVAREMLADGTVRFAVAVPSSATPLTLADLDRAPLRIRQAEGGEQPGMAGGLIVWVRLWNARTYMERPLVTDSGWTTSLSAPGVIPAGDAPGPGPTFEYSRPGDMVRVSVRLQDATYDTQALVDNFRTHQNANGLTYDAAVSTYEATLASNRSSLVRILADANRHVTLRQELAEGRYEFTASMCYFVPRP